MNKLIKIPISLKISVSFNLTVIKYVLISHPQSSIHICLFLNTATLSVPDETINFI